MIGHYSYRERIDRALFKAEDLIKSYENKKVNVRQKGHDGPVTDLDEALNSLLFDELPSKDEGWLSEESLETGDRFNKSHVWIVDPIDGTHQFIRGRAEWAVSIALSENGTAIEGAIFNPWAQQMFNRNEQGAVQLNNKPTHITDKKSLETVTVLVSKAELRWGNLDHLRNLPIELNPVGSIAYRLALVAAGYSDATISLEPKNEWDVAAGILLIQAAGGTVTDLNGENLVFNKKNTLLNGIIAAGNNTHHNLLEEIRKPRSNIWVPFN
jgi:myo-inositol-1(or 4)-monophosphatase